jgi:dolichol-phosphate mannosyltransferase
MALTGKRRLIFLPTYNERGGIVDLIWALLGLGLEDLDILVVDDASPDGTADLVDQIFSKRGSVKVLRRTGVRGRGLAGRDAFLYALEGGYECLVEMDADFSHQVRHVPQLLKALESADLAIGSRFVPGGSDDDRPGFRRLLTRCANAYARIILSLPVRDANSGFRAWSRKALEALRPESLRSIGPSIIHEALFRAARAEIEIVEVPIEFIDRKRGDSKLSMVRLIAGYIWILRLFFLSIIRAE